MFCQKCGKQLADNAKFCQYCGQRTSADNMEKLVRESLELKKRKSIGTFLLIMFSGIIVGVMGLYVGEKLILVMQKSDEGNPIMSQETEAQEDTLLENTTNIVTEDITENNIVESKELELIFLLKSLYLTQYDSNGNAQCKEKIQESEYDKQGNEIKQIQYDVNGTVISSAKYEYDEQGNRTKESIYDVDGHVQGIMKYEYDAQGKIVQLLSYDADGKLNFELEIEHDAQGNITQELQYEGKSLRWCTKFKYDVNGNKTEEITYNGEGTLVSKREWEFDENGNWTRLTYVDSSGNITSEIRAEYGVQGNQLRYVTYDADEIILEEVEYKYDKYGNYLKKITYDADRNILKVMEYEYISMEVPKEGE